MSHSSPTFRSQPRAAVASASDPTSDSFGAVVDAQPTAIGQAAADPVQTTSASVSNQPAAFPTSSASTPLASVSPWGSVAQRCHTDALLCIFVFLSLKDLLPALHSCRDWYAAGCKGPLGALSVRLESGSIVRLVTSPWRCHIAEVAVDYWSGDMLSLRRLRQLRALPRLTALQVPLSYEDVDAQMRFVERSDELLEQRTQLWRDALPPQLRILGLHMVVPPSQPTRQSLIAALPSMSSLHSLELGMMLEDLDLSPLLQLSQLRHLKTLRHHSPSQCAVVKQLGSLTSLQSTCLFIEPDALLALLTPPHRLQQLKQIPDPETLTLPLLVALQQLAALTDLQPSLLAPESWAGLGTFSQLRTLSVCWEQGFTTAQQSALEASLNALPNLSVLTLSVHLPLTEVADGAPLFLGLRLPALRKLIFDRSSVPSLSFLQHSPLLEQLQLWNCAPAPSDCVMALLRDHPPPHLRQLVLFESARLSADEEAALIPPSALLPSLKSLDYYYCSPPFP